MSLTLGQVQNDSSVACMQIDKSSLIESRMSCGNNATVISVTSVASSSLSDVKKSVTADITHPKGLHEIARLADGVSSSINAVSQNTRLGIAKFFKGATPLINVFDLFLAVFGLVGKASSFIDAVKQRKAEKGKKLAEGVHGFKVSVAYAGVQLSCAVLDLTAKVLGTIRWLGSLKFHNMPKAVMAKLTLAGEGISIVRYTLKSIFAINEIRDSNKVINSTMFFADSEKTLYVVSKETAKDIAKTNRRQYIVKLVETVTLLAMAVLGVAAFLSMAVALSPALPWVFTALGAVVLGTTIAGSIYKATVKHKIQNAIVNAGFVTTHTSALIKSGSVELISGSEEGGNSQ